ncbi:MAG TPA: proline racemase family protein [Thermoanaerobaculia bacterium]|jgi:trans-L-3-hydroxyproline dehydratase
MKDFPRHWRRLTTIDAHAGGEPFRVVTGGVPELVGATILERRRWAREHLDGLRRVLMWEPRGHADMYGCFLTAPVTPGADLGVVFLHNEGYSTMCGHGVIALAKVALEMGLLPAVEPETRVGLDTPAGLVTAWARLDNGRVGRVRFLNVPSFVVELDAEVEVPGLGRLRYDLAYGGAFYACVAAADAGVACAPGDFRELIARGTTGRSELVVDPEDPLGEGFLLR